MFFRVVHKKVGADFVNKTGLTFGAESIDLAPHEFLSEICSILEGKQNKGAPIVNNFDGTWTKDGNEIFDGKPCSTFQYDNIIYSYEEIVDED